MSFSAFSGLADPSDLADPIVLARSAIGGDSTAPRPGYYKIIGLILAIASGLFIGTSFVLKKVGLIRANVKYNEEAGEGYGYLKNGYWWGGMILMIVGEICNFVAYAFVDAILVTPLGALSVVVTTVLSAIFLKERLSFVGKVGCFSCIVGSIVIAVNAPTQSAVATIQDMQRLVIAPGFLSYAGVVIISSACIAIWVAPKYGKKNMMVYLTICSLIGGLSVVATQGLGAAIVAQASGTPQFKHWFLYVLLAFVISTLLTEIIYLNKALNLFNAALVTPTYYVFFTSATIVSSAILFRGFHGSVTAIITVVLGFLQICAGVVLLQLSKSAKQLPEAAVLDADLDDLGGVTGQAESEYDPRGDAIRGTGSLIRSMSNLRQLRQLDEAKKIREEHLGSIDELGTAQGGVRRRRTPRPFTAGLSGRSRTWGGTGTAPTGDIPAGIGSDVNTAYERAELAARGSDELDTDIKGDLEAQRSSRPWSPLDDTENEKRSPPVKVLVEEVASARSSRAGMRMSPAPKFQTIEPSGHGHPSRATLDVPKTTKRSTLRDFSFSTIFRKVSGQTERSRSRSRAPDRAETEEERMGLVQGDAVGAEPGPGAETDRDTDTDTDRCRVVSDTKSELDSSFDREPELESELEPEPVRPNRARHSAAGGRRRDTAGTHKTRASHRTGGDESGVLPHQFGGSDDGSAVGASPTPQYAGYSLSAVGSVTTSGTRSVVGPAVDEPWWKSAEVGRLGVPATPATAGRSPLVGGAGGAETMEPSPLIPSRPDDDERRPEAQPEQQSKQQPEVQAGKNRRSRQFSTIGSSAGMTLPAMNFSAISLGLDERSRSRSNGPAELLDTNTQASGRDETNVSTPTSSDGGRTPGSGVATGRQYHRRVRAPPQTNRMWVRSEAGLSDIMSPASATRPLAEIPSREEDMESELDSDEPASPAASSGRARRERSRAGVEVEPDSHAQSRQSPTRPPVRGAKRESYSFI